MQDLNNTLIGSPASPGLGGELFLQAHTVDKFEKGDLRGFFHTDLANYPEGQDLRFHVGYPIHFLVYPVLRKVTGLFGAYNLLVVIILALNGLTTCHFLRKRGISLYLAVIGGLALMFNPYFIIKLKLGFLSKLVFFWCPLYLDSLLETRESRKTGSAIKTVILLVASMTGYPQYSAYLIILTMVIITYDLLFEKNRGWTIVYAAVTGIVLIPAIIFFLGSTKIDANKDKIHFLPDSRLPEIPVPSVDILNFWSFSPMEKVPSVHMDLPMYISPLIMMLFAAGVFTSGKGRKGLAATALFMLLLSAGPYLQYDMVPVKIRGHAILLPFYISMHGPAGFRLGFPLRVFPIAFLCMLPFALYPVHRLIRDKKQSTVIIAIIAITAILFLEAGALSPGLYGNLVSPSEIPRFLETLQRGEGGILQLPQFPHGTVGIAKDLYSSRSVLDRHFYPMKKHLDHVQKAPHYYSYLAALSGRPQVNLLRPDPMLEPWLGPEFIPSLFLFTNSHIKELLAEKGVRDVVIHRDFISGKMLEGSAFQLDKALMFSLGSPERYREENIDIYHISESSSETEETAGHE